MHFSKVTYDYIGDNVSDLLENNKTDKNSIAILSPHAGYFFSGDVAALSFNSVIDKEFENVFILSTSHTSGFRGCCIPNDTKYETPFGDMEIKGLVYDTDLIKYNNEFFNNDHTIEVLLPFIQKGIKYKNIIPIMIGDNNIDNLRKISMELEKYFTDDNLFVISSDFSHYPTYEEAIVVDGETKNLILKKNSDDFIDGIFKLSSDKKHIVTRMCGWSAYLILLFIIEKRDDIEIKFLRYKNSAELSTGRNRTVGYYSISFIKK